MLVVNSYFSARDTGAARTKCSSQVAGIVQDAPINLQGARQIQSSTSLFVKDDVERSKIIGSDHAVAAQQPVAIKS